MDITVVGSLNMDIVAVVNHMPQAGETVKAAQAALHTGGKGANQAIAAARYGGRVCMVGAVGNDTFAGPLREALEAAHVDVAGVIPKDGSSGMALITVEADGQNRIVVCDGANGLLTPADVDHACAKIPWPIGSALVVQNEIPRETVRQALTVAHQRQWRVLWNVAPVVPMEVGWLGRDDIVAVNESEASRLTGKDVVDVESARLAAQRLMEFGPGMVLVTLGALGSVAVSREWGTMVIPAREVIPVDTTAAGDTFLGVFAADWDGVSSPEPSLQVATAAAALCVTRSGAQNSIPQRQEVITFLTSSV
ncbi:ribokinase [Alicyclobacillus sacchari]|uniref:Ribokinase n=1 Tax=Alicyclobacillus sacchari TaxID=392010 RepID=A0A4V6QCZ5_9BACL|nr:ribokinase [Alicyclobacillus sacchari]TDY42144.1 ribokinase [Alicyclobacillus sacchari]